MSSNMYGFTCSVQHGARVFDVQIVYKGTRDDCEESLNRATADWDDMDPRALAKFELEHRDWSKVFHGDVRIGVQDCWGGWLDTDPQNDPTWSPPRPTEREVVEAIASGHFDDVVHGWDT